MSKPSAPRPTSRTTPRGEVTHHGRRSEHHIERSPRWWGPTIGGLAALGFAGMLTGTLGGPRIVLFVGLAAITAALLMAMRWR